MKKLTSKEPISLRIDGSTLLEITPEGCLATDSSADIAVQRLGANITVEDYSVAAAVTDVTGGSEPALEDMLKPQLVEKAKALGLDPTGNKPDLVARIADHLAKESDVSTPPEGENPDEANTDANPEGDPPSSDENPENTTDVTDH